MSACLCRLGRFAPIQVFGGGVRRIWTARPDSVTVCTAAELSGPIPENCAHFPTLSIRLCLF